MSIQVMMQMLGQGFLVSLQLFVLTLLGSIPLGIPVAFMRMSKIAPLRWIARIYISVMRGTPLMLQLLILYYVPGVLLGTSPWAPGESGRFLASAIAFILNYAFYFSEIFRAGIEGVPKGQQEAGQVLGMTKTQIFFKVTLLQMVKRIVPPMSNEIITLVKDTSLASVIGTVEMFTRAKQIVASPNTPGMLALVAAGVFYYVFNYVVAFAMEKWEQALRYYR